MPAFDDQQAVQQLLSGLNTMQMQAGLMPGQTPYTGHAASLEMQRSQRDAPSPSDFSNHVRVQFQNAYAPQASISPFHMAVTPVARNSFAQGVLPPPSLGMGWGVAQQQVQATQNQWLTGAQTGLGLGARTGLGAASSAIGAGIGGVLGGAPGAWLGGMAMPFVTDALMGGAVENMAMLPFRGAIQQRQRAMALQGTTTGFLRTGPELHASGQGLSMTSSMDLERQLSRMSGNRDFKRDTQGAFNRQDLMKITQISGQLGMLDQATNADQIARDVGRIGRALSSFMKIAEEPDVQQALQMMGRMRGLGMAVPEMTQAASNARTYARMAGVSVQGMLQQGMQGAMVFQQAGMSGATGLQTGMAAAGSAGVMAGMLNPRQLEMLGGREGITRNLTTGAAQMADLDSLMPGLLRRGKNGSLEVDTDAMLKVSSGQMDINEVIRKSAERMSDLGPTSMVQELGTRRNELRDQMMNAYGGQGAILAPMMLARQIAATGATNFAGGLRMAGLNEQQARTVELQATPEFFRRLEEQREAQNFENKVAMTRQRQGVYDRGDQARTQEGYNFLANQQIPGLNSSTRDLQRTANRFVNARDDWFRAEFGEEQDAQEVQAMLGGGEMIGYDPAMRVSPLQVQRSQGGLRDTRRAGRRYQRAQRNQQEIAERTESVDESRLQRSAGLRFVNRMALNPLALPLAAAAHGAVGAYDWAVSNPGQQTLDDVVMSHETWQTRALDKFGLVGANAIGGMESAEQRASRIGLRADSMERGGRIIEEGLDATYDKKRVAAVQTASGLTDPEKFARVRARMAASMTAYARETMGGAITGNTEGFDERDMRKRLITDLRGDKSISEEDAQRYAHQDALISDVMRVMSPGLRDRDREFFTRGAAAGGDTAAKRGTAGGRATAEQIEKVTGEFTGHLGIKAGDLDSGQRKQLLSMFSGEGPEADARRLLFQARGLESLEGEGSAEGVRRATLLRDRVERMDLTPDQRAAAEAEVRGFSESAGTGVMRRVGESATRNWSKLDDVNERGRDEAESTSDIAQQRALIEKFGPGAAEVFRKARDSGASGVKALQAYQKALGKPFKADGWTSPNDPFTKEQRAAFDAGTMTDEDIEGIGEKGVKYRVTPIIANANTVRGQQEPTETVESRATATLAAQAQQQTETLNASFGRFDASIGEFKNASKAITDVVKTLAGKQEASTLIRPIKESVTLAKTNSMSQGAGSGG